MLKSQATYRETLDHANIDRIDWLFYDVLQEGKSLLQMKAEVQLQLEQQSEHYYMDINHCLPIHQAIMENKMTKYAPPELKLKILDRLAKIITT